MIFSEVDFASPDFDQILDLRDRVLRQPLGLQFSVEQISEEFRHHHFGCYDGEHLLGTLVMQDVGNDAAKMRQVAVEPDLQNRGVGKFMVANVESWATSRQYKVIELAARQEAVAFYISLDYEVIGEPFTEVGIPHRKMRKFLVAAT